MGEQGYGIFEEQASVLLVTQPQTEQSVTSGNTMEGTWKWSSNLTFQLIELRRKYDSWFTGKRGSAKSGWEKIRDELGLGEAFEYKVVKKKWQNLLQKYKELKYPSSNPPQDTEVQEISWPYYAAVDKYLRTKESFGGEAQDISKPKPRKILPRKGSVKRMITEPTVMIQTLPLSLAPPPPPPPQDFCLRWDTYSSNLQSSIPDILKSERFVDVTLACEGRSIKCHKIILSACSPYLDDLLTQNPCQHPIILMKDLKFSELSAIVEFMYKGEVNVKEDKLQSLLATAQTLQIKGLATTITAPPGEVASCTGNEITESTQDIYRPVAEAVYPPKKRRRNNMEQPSFNNNTATEHINSTEQQQTVEMMANVKVEPTQYENPEDTGPEYGFVIDARSLAQENTVQESMQDQCYSDENEKSADNGGEVETTTYQMIDQSILDQQNYSPATLMLQAQHPESSSDLGLGTNPGEHIDDETSSPIELDSSDEADLIVGN